MAVIPQSNVSGLPAVTSQHLKDNDPSVMNRIFRLLATQIQSVQTGIPSSSTTRVTNITQNITSGGPGGGSSSPGGSTAAPVVTIQGAHLTRLADYLAPDQPAGCYFYETDRTVNYLNYISPSNAQVWQWVSGTMQATFSNRPGDLGQYDAGFLFYATDQDLTYQWSGNVWNLLNNIEPILQDTHANRLANYPSVTYALSTLFWEQDRGVFYIVENATGTVNTSGTAVAWASGNHFINTGSGFNAAQWPANTLITINGVVYPIASVSSATALTLTATAGTQTGVAYSVASGRWVWAAGTCDSVQASIPADLGENDAGFLESVTDYAHELQWGGSSWGWGPGESGSGYFQDFAVAPTGSGWHLCDGSTGVAYLKKDGTTGTVNLPNPNSTAAYRKNGSTYASTITAAQAPAIGGSTGTGNAVIGNDSGSGTVVASGTGATVATHTHNHTDSGHTHTLPAATTLPGDPVANYQAITYFRQ